MLQTDDRNGQATSQTSTTSSSGGSADEQDEQAGGNSGDVYEQYGGPDSEFVRARRERLASLTPEQRQAELDYTRRYRESMARNDPDSQAARPVNGGRNGLLKKPWLSLGTKAHKMARVSGSGGNHDARAIGPP